MISFSNMRFFVMFVTAVCVLLVSKLPTQYPVRFHRFDIVQTSQSRGQHLC